MFLSQNYNKDTYEERLGKNFYFACRPNFSWRKFNFVFVWVGMYKNFFNACINCLFTFLSEFGVQPGSQSLANT